MEEKKGTQMRKEWGKTETGRGLRACPGRHRFSYSLEKEVQSCLGAHSSLQPGPLSTRVLCKMSHAASCRQHRTTSNLSAPPGGRRGVQVQESGVPSRPPPVVSSPLFLPAHTDSLSQASPLLCLLPIPSSSALLSGRRGPHASRVTCGQGLTRPQSPSALCTEYTSVGCLGIASES